MKGMCDCGFLLAKLRDLCFVLRRCCGLIYTDLPLRKPLVGIFDLCDFFFIVRIDRLLWLDADNRGFYRPSLSKRPF